jgi:two-component system chemotaxis response regulator CheB
MRKPSMAEFNNPEFYQRFLEKVRLAAQTRLQPKPKTGSEALRQLTRSGGGNHQYAIVVIGASTGGPVAVREILRQLPAEFPYGIALVQHLEQGFDEGYARWLNEASLLHVKLAGRTEVIAAGEVVVAPVDKHLVVRHGRLHLDDGPKILHQKPSVDVLFESAATQFGKRVFGVLLTGMGRDGAAGCAAIVKRGGFTLVQDQSTSAIFGMPKAAIEANGASLVLPLQDIATYLVTLGTRRV